MKFELSMTFLLDLQASNDTERQTDRRTDALQHVMGNLWEGAK